MPKQLVVPNAMIGLGSPGTPVSEIQIGVSLFNYVYKEKEAPTPAGTVGKAQTLRERILVASIFPDIYTRNKK